MLRARSCSSASSRDCRSACWPSASSSSTARAGSSTSPSAASARWRRRCWPSPSSTTTGTTGSGFALALVTGAAFAAVMELTVITRLFTAPRVIVLVATIGIAQLADLFRISLPDLGAELGARFPLPFTGEWTVVGVRVSSAELIVLVAVPLIAFGLSHDAGPHSTRQDGAGVCGQRRQGTSVGNQPEDRLDLRVDAGRSVGRALHDDARRHEGSARRPRDDRARDADPRPGRCPDRVDGVVPESARRRRRDRCHRGPRPVQLSRAGRPHRGAALRRHCGRGVVRHPTRPRHQPRVVLLRAARSPGARGTAQPCGGSATSRRSSP